MNDVDVARDDLALDALAAGRLPDGGDDVLGLLHALRTDLDRPAHGPAAPAAPAVVPLRPRRRTFALVALSAAAGLALGGLLAGAVVASDQPGELLHAAHEALLGDPKDGERVTKLLDDAAEALAEGDRREALRRLDDAAERVGDVEDLDQRAALVARLGRLRAIAAAAPTATQAPSATPSASPSDDSDDRTPEPAETETPDGDDNSGKGSSSSGSGSDGSGGDDSRSDSSGKGSDDVLKTLDPDDSSGSGGGDRD